MRYQLRANFFYQLFTISLPDSNAFWVSTTVGGCSCVLNGWSCPTVPPLHLPTCFHDGSRKREVCVRDGQRDLFPPAPATINKLYRYLAARQRDLCVKLPGINHLCCKLGQISRERWCKTQPENPHKNKHSAFSSGHPYVSDPGSDWASNRTHTELEAGRFN